MILSPPFAGDSSTFRRPSRCSLPFVCEKGIQGTTAWFLPTGGNPRNLNCHYNAGCQICLLCTEWGPVCAFLTADHFWAGWSKHMPVLSPSPPNPAEPPPPPPPRQMRLCHTGLHVQDLFGAIPCNFVFLTHSLTILGHFRKIRGTVLIILHNSFPWLTCGKLSLPRSELLWV